MYSTTSRYFNFVTKVFTRSEVNFCSLKLGSIQAGDELAAAPRPHPPVRRGGGGESRGHGGSPEQQTQAAPSEGIC